MPSPAMHKMAFPIVTPEALKFWGSRHKCNRAKAIISFSVDIPDANQNLRRYGFHRHLRRRALLAYSAYVAMPDMTTIPFSPMSIPWWECMPEEPIVPPLGHWALWIDDTIWQDPEKWQEWIPDNPLNEETQDDDTTGNDSKEATNSSGDITDQ